MKEVSVLLWGGGGVGGWWGICVGVECEGVEACSRVVSSGSGSTKKRDSREEVRTPEQPCVRKEDDLCKTFLLSKQQPTGQNRSIFVHFQNKSDRKVVRDDSSIQLCRVG